MLSTMTEVSLTVDSPHKHWVKPIPPDFMKLWIASPLRAPCYPDKSIGLTFTSALQSLSKKSEQQRERERGREKYHLTCCLIEKRRKRISQTLGYKSELWFPCAFGECVLGNTWALCGIILAILAKAAAPGGSGHWGQHSFPSAPSLSSSGSWNPCQLHIQHLRAFLDLSHWTRSSAAFPAPWTLAKGLT